MHVRIQLFLFCISLVAVACHRLAEKKVVSHELFESGESRGVIENKKIDEASGLAASINNPGRLWTHNDSGDGPRIFLISDTGEDIGSLHLTSFKNRDWEDIAVGPGPVEGKSYIYVGDIGDNDAKYPIKYIYRTLEPTIDFKGEPQRLVTNKADSLPFVLPDRIRDAETLMLDPLTRDLYIVSKRETQVSVYKLPYPQSTKVPDTAQFLFKLPYAFIVGGDISADGTEVLMKNYQSVFYWKKKGNETIEELLQTEPRRLPYEEEPQGEAIAFDREGKGYYTLSESAFRSKPKLYFYKRKKVAHKQNRPLPTVQTSN